MSSKCVCLRNSDGSPSKPEFHCPIHGSAKEDKPITTVNAPRLIEDCGGECEPETVILPCKKCWDRWKKDIKDASGVNTTSVGASPKGKTPHSMENSDTSLILLDEIASLMGLPPGNARDRARPILSLITQETTKARREELRMLEKNVHEECGGAWENVNHYFYERLRELK